MPTPPKLSRAFLQKVTFDAAGGFTEEGEKVTVQFNPQTLTVTYGARGIKQTGAQLTPGPGSTLKLDLHFDVSALAPNEFSGPAGQGVSGMTRKIIQFFEHYDQPGQQHKETGVQFVWGKFLFVGVVTGLSETFDYFAADGTPLRSKIGFTLKTPAVREKKG